MMSQIRTLISILKHTFTKPDTIEYPEQKPYLSPRYRGRIVLTRDPDGQERCVACNLCSVACPVDCIAVQKTESEDGRWLAESFRINFSRCIMCGFCEEACPTHAIQLTPDVELAEYDRQNLVYEKENLLIDGPGKYHDYNFYKVAGKAIEGKEKGQAINEKPPIDIRSLMP
jgi:NADH-quinone oxidoreductase subunit I